MGLPYSTNLNDNDYGKVPEAGRAQLGKYHWGSASLGAFGLLLLIVALAVACTGCHTTKRCGFTPLAVPSTVSRDKPALAIDADSRCRKDILFTLENAQQLLAHTTNANGRIQVAEQVIRIATDGLGLPGWTPRQHLQLTTAQVEALKARGTDWFDVLSEELRDLMETRRD